MHAPELAAGNQDSILTITMRRSLVFLLCIAWLLPAITLADRQPAAGKLLVATELVQGAFFVETVVLLLHYDGTGGQPVGARGRAPREPGQAAEANAEGLVVRYRLEPQHRTVVIFGQQVQQSIRPLADIENTLP